MSTSSSTYLLYEIVEDYETVTIGVKKIPLVVIEVSKLTGKEVRKRCSSWYRYTSEEEQWHYWKSMILNQSPEIFRKGIAITVAAIAIFYSIFHLYVTFNPLPTLQTAFTLQLD